MCGKVGLVLCSGGLTLCGCPGLEEGSSGGEGTSANYVSFIPFDKWIGSAQVGLRWLGHSCVLIFSVL